MEGDSGLDVLSSDGILDIIPASEYDPFEAKFCASLFWLVFHATEDGGLEDVPPVVSSPIQRHNKKSGFVVHPEIVEFLCKGEVYCIVCTRIFPGKVTLAGHWSVIQTLSRNGVYVVDSTDIAVTDASLEQTSPFNQGAHIALMDALMTAYSSQVVSIQSVVQAVRRFSTFSASRELPFDLEDALLLWVNKINVAVNAKYAQPTPSSSGKLLRNRGQVKKVGLRSEDETAAAIVFPVIDDLLKGLCNGRPLLAVLMFYEPNVVNIEDICCSSQLSTEDSIRNLDVFLGLCSQYFCTSVLALKLEDILYGSPSLKVNIVALLAEIFSKCERNPSKEVKTGSEKSRSKTSCSENGDVRLNGYNDDNGADDGRSHSAPVSRNKNSSDKTSINNTTSDDKNIALKIQNYVQNESVDMSKAPNKTPQSLTSSKVTLTVTPSNVTSSDVTSSNMTPSNVTPSNMTSSNMTPSNVTPSNMTSSDDVEVADDQNTVEVQGVVVKLRKKIPRSVEPGGGHEALLSRRMKKSLCGWSQEDISDTTSQTSEHEGQLAGKSEEMRSEIITCELPDDQADHPDISTPHEPEHNLNLDLHSFQEDNPPVDMLSPISETTEPGGSPGNSLNNSMSSTHDQQEFCNHGDKNPARGLDFDLTPPKAQTPRKPNNLPRAIDNPIPRGSYVLSDVTHTLESAFAAGIPIVERESFDTRTSTSTSHSSDGSRTYRSGLSGSLTNGIHEKSNGASDSSNFTDQRYAAVARDSSNVKDQRYQSDDAALELSSLTDQQHHQQIGALEQSNYSEQLMKSGGSEQSENHWPGRRNDNRFSTFTKSKYRNGVEKDAGNSKQCGEIHKGSELDSSATAQVAKRSEGLSTTWFSQAENEQRSVGRSERSGEPRARKTNWGEMADEASESSDWMEKAKIMKAKSWDQGRRTFDFQVAQTSHGSVSRIPPTLRF